MTSPQPDPNAAPDLVQVAPLAILLSLLLGIGGGLALSAMQPALVAPATALIEPVGALWLRALQMTIVPLVVSLLVIGIVQSVAAARAGRVAGLSMLHFVVILWVGTIGSALLMPLLLNWFPIPASAAQGLATSLTTVDPVGAVPSFGEFIKSLVPTNPIAAAAGDSILPLIVFTAIFSVALTRLKESQRTLMVGIFEALAQAMLIVIGWVLRLAPVGVFALGFVLAARAGSATLGLFVHYVLIVSSMGVIVLLAGYPIAAIAGRRSLLAFARAVAPAQAVALSTQSSLASLPAMLRATGQLGIRASTAEVTLPLAVALFRATSPAMNLAVVIYVAHLTGTPLTVTTLMIGVVVAATTTMGSVSLPGTISFIASCGPIALAMGVPLEPLALLVAVETLPDIIRTIGNVTNDVAAVSVVDRYSGGPAVNNGESHV